MSFKEFDLSDYIKALESFKQNSTDDIIKHWGSIENFDLFIQKIKDDEDQVAKLAIQQFGSVEKYTETMKYNLEHFSEIMKKHQINNQNLLQKSETLYQSLTSDMGRDVSTPEIQAIVHEIIQFTRETTTVTGMGENFWDMVIESYSRDLVKATTDAKYGKGASDYIARALQYYFRNNQFPHN